MTLEFLLFCFWFFPEKPGFLSLHLCWFERRISCFVEGEIPYGQDSFFFFRHNRARIVLFLIVLTTLDPSEEQETMRRLAATSSKHSQPKPWIACLSCCFFCSFLFCNFGKRTPLGTRYLSSFVIFRGVEQQSAGNRITNGQYTTNTTLRLENLEAVVDGNEPSDNKTRGDALRAKIGHHHPLFAFCFSIFSRPPQHLKFDKFGNGA